VHFCGENVVLACVFSGVEKYATFSILFLPGVKEAVALREPDFGFKQGAKPLGG
jgi:hypothetical protein